VVTLQEEIIKGESKNLEFKRELPRLSEKYIKTVIAFSNTNGGKIVIGVDDKTRKIIGVDKKEAFQIRDSIANAISDSCEPQIIPNIEFKTINERSVIVIEISRGLYMPYFLKDKGRENGTYVRVDGTSRLADIIKVKELELQGTNTSWDELICLGYEVADSSIKQLCQDIKRHMVDSAFSMEDKKAVKDVTENNLLNWKVLKKENDRLLSTNSFALFTSDYFRFSKIQCALFKGIERDIFIDKKQYSGPLYEQIEKAYQFVLRHINLGAEIEGIVRRDSYELPTGAIREMIVNAVCHRNYMDNSCVQVAIYDDRVEVTSPGGLYGGLTLEDIMSGRSRIRNLAITKIFSHMEIIEEWGSGIKRIMQRAQEYDLPTPEFQETANTFRVNLYRKTIKHIEKKPIKILEEADKNKIEKPINTFRKAVKYPTGTSLMAAEEIVNYSAENSITISKKADKNKIEKPIKIQQKAEKESLKKLRQELLLSHIREFGSISNKEARGILNLAESTTKRILRQMVEENKIFASGSGKSRRYIDFYLGE